LLLLLLEEEQLHMAHLLYRLLVALPIYLWRLLVLVVLVVLMLLVLLVLRERQRQRLLLRLRLRPWLLIRLRRRRSSPQLFGLRAPIVDYLLLSGKCPLVHMPLFIDRFFLGFKPNVCMRTHVCVSSLYSNGRLQSCNQRH
jgi:hypothetical protein